MNETIDITSGCQPLVAPREEKLITRDWTVNANEPLVSIACSTYNHCNYIEDALNGFLAQKTNFGFEIVIRDDASDDGTKELLQIYAEKYPNIIRLFMEAENQWTKGVRPLPSVIGLTRSSYIAICEGDDYWTSPNKIQTQYDSMQLHSACDLCFHSAKHINHENDDEKIMGRYRNCTGHVTASSIMRKKWGRIPTASLMVTRDSAIAFAKFRNRHSDIGVGDLFLQAHAVDRGGALFIDQPWSVYREFVVGSWSHRHSQSDSSDLTKQTEILKSYETLKNCSNLSKSMGNNINHAMWKRIRAVLVNEFIASADKRRIVKNYRSALSCRLLLLAFCTSRIPYPVVGAIKRVWRVIKATRVAFYGNSKKSAANKSPNL